MDSTDEKIVRQMKLCPIFSGLTDEEVAGLARQCELAYLKRGEKLFEAGHPASHIYIILMGSAKLLRSHPDGKERILHILLKGEMFGAAVAIQGGYYPVNAVAMEQSSVLKVPANVFRDVFLRHEKIGKILISQMGERMQQAHNDRIAFFDSVDKRIAAFLTDLLDRSRAQIGPTSRIPVPLTRQDIADRVGATVETVIRTLSAWSKEDLIRTHEKHIEIPDDRLFRQSVGIDT